MRFTPEWAGDPVAGDKFSRDIVEIPRYASIERDFANESQRLVSDYLAGRIDRNVLVSSFKGRLEDAETSAFVAGRRARGDTSTSISDPELQMIYGRHSRNMGYFNGFVQDMDSGVGRMDYMKRAKMYAQSLWSLYTRGEASDWDEPEKQNSRYFNVLDPDAEHCPECIEITKKSRDQGGLTWEELVELGFPGERQCMTHCRCHIRVVRKATVLPERFEDVAMARSGQQGIKSLEELLGGEDFPLKIPAAGLPSVKTSPDVISQSLAAAGTDREALARRLPLIPLVMTEPDQVWDAQGGGKVFERDGLGVHVDRDENGIWRVLALILGKDLRKEAA